MSSLSVIIIVAVVSCIAFLAVVLGMAVGVIFGRRSISGSCGGLANQKDEDGKVSCGLCDNPADACRELRSRMEADESPERADREAEASHSR